MIGLSFDFCGTTLTALGSGALFWPSQSLLCVSDLHLGRTERIARQGGQMIPPYENTDTLQKLETEIEATSPKIVICLGDSFDDLASVNALTDPETDWITRLQAGRQWIWIEGNHDPAPLNLGGTHLQSYETSGLCFRHIATDSGLGEISGHYHPKIGVSAQGRRITRPAFVFDSRRLILPAFGTYTGGMPVSKPPLRGMFERSAKAIVTGQRPRMLSVYSATSASNTPAASRRG